MLAVMKMARKTLVMNIEVKTTAVRERLNTTLNTTGTHRGC